MFEFKLDPAQLKVVLERIPAVQRAMELQAEIIPREAAHRLQEIVIDALITQKYANDYDEWSVTYRKWKSKQPHPYDFLALSEDLLRDISVTKTARNRWKVGPVTPEVQKYAYVMEYGSKEGVVPARPLYGKLGGPRGVGDFAVGDYMKSGHYGLLFATAKRYIHKQWMQGVKRK